MRIARIKYLVVGAAAVAALAGGGTAIALAAGGTPAHAASQDIRLSSQDLASQAAGPAGRCLQLAERLRANGRPQAARHVAAICVRLRIARLVLHTIHGQFTVETRHGPRTIAVEQGLVESVGGGAITVKAKDGTTWTWDLVGNTVVRQHGSKVAASTLAHGQRVFVAGPVVSGVNDARLIVIRPAASAVPAA
jgi:hypothetical protein